MRSSRGGFLPGRWLLRLVLGTIGLYALALRPWQLRWGASAADTSTPMPGDELVPDAAYVTTRAITVQAPAEAIWPWLTQMGQGRAGFYTYDRLEQIAGVAIRSADQIVPELQQIALGQTISLSSVGGPTVTVLEPGRSLVLFETMDLRTGQAMPSTPRAQWAMDWTWSFTLQPTRERATRLLIRTRAAYRPHALLALFVVVLLEPIHFVMERGMLLGIKRRAEHAYVSASTGAPVGQA